MNCLFNLYKPILATGRTKERSHEPNHIKHHRSGFYMIQAYHSQSVSQTYYPTKNVIPPQLIPRNNIDIPIYYIHSLTKSQQRIFGYLFGFASASEIMLKLSTIANKTNCSLITVRRALQKFHDHAVIIKYQKYSCYDINNFKIDFKALNQLNSKFLAENEHLNNINKLFIYTTTSTTTTINKYSSINARVDVCTPKTLKQKKEVTMEPSKLNQLFQRYELELTKHGEAYFSIIPDEVITFALDTYKSTPSIQSASKFMRKVVVDCCKKKNIYLSWPPYFLKVEQMGLDKYSDLVVSLKKPSSTQGLLKQVTVGHKIEIEMSGTEKRIKQLQDYIRVKQKQTDNFLKKGELEKWEQKIIEDNNSNIIVRQQHLDKIMAKQKEIGDLSNENINSDMSQAEMEFRSLYLKMKHNATELNNWKSIADNIETTPALFRDQTKSMSEIIITRLTRALDKDLKTLTELENQMRAESVVTPPDDNAFADLCDQSEIH